jgi:hypothetical protein
MRNLVLLAFSLAVVTIGALSAEVAGLWKASFTPPDGHHHESTLDLQVTDGKISGKISSKRGSVPITDGKVNGSEISFTVNRKGNGDDITVTFSGTVEKDTMKLKMQYGERQPIPIIARRVP